MAARVSRNLGFFSASPARNPQAVDRLLLDGSDTPLRQLRGLGVAAFFSPFACCPMRVVLDRVAILSGSCQNLQRLPIAGRTTRHFSATDSLEEHVLASEKWTLHSRTCTAASLHQLPLHERLQDGCIFRARSKGQGKAWYSLATCRIFSA